MLEDEEGVRKLVRSILQRNGYRVIEAKHGGDALRIANNPGVIDLLLTDVVMPQMGGAESASRLLAEAALLQKPITPAALLSKVREVLDSP